MKKLTATLLGLLLAPAALTAGTVEKAPIVEPCAVPFTGTVSVGYETSYIFRGLDLGGHAPWMGIDTNWALLENLSMDLGAWYINPTNPRHSEPDDFRAHENDELDLYATFNFPLWIFKASLGTIFYNYPEAADTLGVDDTRNIETNFGLGYSLPWFDVNWLTAYDFNWEGWYQEVSASKTVDLTDCLAAGLTAGVGFYDNYNLTSLNGYSHTFVTLGLTWAMTETAALDLYIGGNFVADDLEALGAKGDQLHGGASVSVSF